MRFFLCLTALAFLALPSHGAETAKDVITKAIEALGGEKAIKKYPASVQKSKGTIQIMGMEVAFNSHEMSLDPDKFKQTIDIEVGGQAIKIIQIVNGENASMSLAGNDMPLPAEAKAELIEGMQLSRIMTLVPLLEEKGYEIKLLGDKAKVEGKEAFVLTVSHKLLREVKLFVDAKSYLITKIEKEGTNGSMETGKQEWFIGDYKKTDGLMLPTKTKILHEGKAFLDVEVTEVKLLEKLDKSEFDVGK